MIYSTETLNEGMIKDLKEYEGQMFSDNFSNTGTSLCMKVDVDSDTVYYMECYGRHQNFTGKNVYGDPRTDKLSHPKQGLKTCSLDSFYGKAIGWV